MAPEEHFLLVSHTLCEDLQCRFVSEALAFFAIPKGRDCIPGLRTDLLIGFDVDAARPLRFSVLDAVLTLNAAERVVGTPLESCHIPNPQRFPQSSPLIDLCR